MVAARRTQAVAAARAVAAAAGGARRSQRWPRWLRASSPATTTRGPGSGDASGGDRPPAEWPRLGFDLANTRAAVGETTVGPGTVADLAPVWEVDGVKGVTGTPVVAGGTVYVGDWTGHLRAIDAGTGDEAWRFAVTAGDATEGPGVSVWSSPAVDIDRGVLYIGTGQAYALPAPPRSDALLALDLRTGREVWSTQFRAG